MSEKNQTTHSYAVGRHMIADFHGCAYGQIATADVVRAILLEAADKAGATVVGETFRYFSPHGVSGFVIISESHFSIHTWPEYSYAAVDIFTCGDSVNFDTAIAFMQSAFQAQRVEITADLHRGTGIGSPIDQSLPPPTAQEHSWNELYHRTDAWGMHLEIELVGAPPQTHESLRELASRLAKRLGHSALFSELETVCNQPDGNPMTSFSGCFYGMQIQAYKRTQSSSVYLEILCNGFQDPKTTGPLAMELSGSKGYRLRVSLRH